MTTELFSILFYISGYVVSYVYYKYDTIKEREKLNVTLNEKFLLWTLRDRDIALYVSLFSWGGMLCVALGKAEDYFRDRKIKIRQLKGERKDRPAKW